MFVLVLYLFSFMRLFSKCSRTTGEALRDRFIQTLKRVPGSGLRRSVVRQLICNTVYFEMKHTDARTQIQHHITVSIVRFHTFNLPNSTHPRVESLFEGSCEYKLVWGYSELMLTHNRSKINDLMTQANLILTGLYCTRSDVFDIT